MDDHGSNLQTRAGDEEEVRPSRSHGSGPAREAQAEVPNARCQWYQGNQQVSYQTLADQLLRLIKLYLDYNSRRSGLTM